MAAWPPHPAEQLRLVGSSNLSLPEHSYVYSLVPTSAQLSSNSYTPLASSGGHLAVLSSDDSVRVLDPSSLQLVHALKNVNQSVTCLKRMAPLFEECRALVTSGRDGFVRCWDTRTSSKTMEFRAVKGEPLSALACSFRSTSIVAGVESEREGPGDAPLYVWDPRNPSTPKISCTECHNDTITEIQFHPTQPDLVLSGSTDGLVNVLKISEPDEDEALYQVINHTSAVQHAGWLNDTDIYALGTDETLSMYRLQNPDDDATELPPVNIGDVRDRLGCEYVVNISWAGTEPVLAFGTYSARKLDLFSFNGLAAEFGLSLSSPATRYSLPSAHGEEIVRDVYIDGGDTDKPTVFTCGEDGQVRAWRLDHTQDTPASEQQKRKAASKSKDVRYKPYALPESKLKNRGYM